MKRFALVMIALLAVTVFTGLTQEARAEVINFDDQGLVGPSVFASASPIPQHLDISTSIGTVQFDFGVILTQTAFLPANQTSVYGTASFVSGMSNPLVITFPSNITNFFLDVYNGLTTNILYSVYDNLGNSALFNLPPNLSSGQTQVGFPAAGNIVYVESITPGAWDFFIDNIHFNEPLPTPIPGSVLLLGSGLVFVLAKRRRS